jgi:hypothetical protein
MSIYDKIINKGRAESDSIRQDAERESKAIEHTIVAKPNAKRHFCSQKLMRVKRLQSPKLKLSANSRKGNRWRL